MLKDSNHRKVLTQALAVGVLLLTMGLAYGTTPRPANILLLVAEDLSPRIGSYGDPQARTPNLDALAQRSTRFTRAFTTAGVCAPSRAALVSGQHQISFGAQHMRSSTAPLGSYLAQPPKDLRALPERLRQLGYFTYTDNKLDYQFSGIRAGSGPFTLWDHEGGSAEDWRKRRPEQPFFGLINFMHTHESGVMRPTGKPFSRSHAQSQIMRKALGLAATPMTDPARVALPPYYPDLPEVRADIARHYDNIHAMDKRVGEILEALEEDGLTKSTVIIWTTDHGDGLPRAKRELFDSGIHVPMLMHRPGQTSARIESRLVSFVDLAPTIYALAGATHKPAHWHGQNLLDPDQPERRYVYASRDRIDEVNDRQRAVRDQRFKYIRSYRPDIPGGHALDYRDNLDMVRAWRAAYQANTLTAVQAAWFEPPGKDQLYDLEADPHELNNLARDPAYADTLARLGQQLDDFLLRVKDTSNLSEAQLRETFLNDNALPTTPAPTVEWRDGRAHLASPIGASIGYRLPGEQNWQLYVEPLQANSFEAKSVRYGWAESAALNFSAPNISPSENP